MNLTYDSLSDRKSNLQTMANPSWEDVQTAIRRLDAERHTEVMLAGSAQMSIGGGGGRYFVSIFTEDERSLVLLDRGNPDDEMVTLMAAGQNVALPRQQVVDVESAIRAARYFVESECADPNLDWIEQ
jgi:hypothetical protein